MSGYSKHLIIAVFVALTCGSFRSAQAGIFKDVAIGLSEAGFNFVGEENFLSGGADLTVSRTFNGETLDFGATELTLLGTPTFEFTTGGRGLDVLDVSFNTANNPLSYTLVTDSGNQLITINGSLLADATAKINSFGYYDLTLDLSSRQTVVEDGRYSNETFENDFDLGPIHIRGNLFADLLGALTDPIFELIGVDNIFYNFSGAALFDAQLGAAAEAALAKARAGLPLTTEERAKLRTASAAARALDLSGPDLLGALDSDILANAALHDDLSSGTHPQIVPEPATLVLLLLSSTAALGWRHARTLRKKA